MDITQLYRLLRRRWPLVLVFASLGAVAGFASTLLPDDADNRPVVTYWSAGEILRGRTGADLDYVRVAPLAVLGPDAEAVAGQRGIDLEAAGLRVVTDVAEATITVSAVATDPADARDTAAAFAEGFLETLNSQELELYEEQLAAARFEAQRQSDRVAEAQTELDLIEGQEAALGEGEVLAARLIERRGRATAERDAAEALLDVAEVTIVDLERIGPPIAPMSILQSVPPRGISAAEFGNRIDQASAGTNAFTVFDVPSTAEATSSAERFVAPMSRAILGGVVGLVLGLLALTVHARLDTRLRTSREVAAAFGLPVLAEVPVMSRRDRRDKVLHAAAEPYSRIAEAHRYLRSVLLFARAAPDSPSDPFATPESPPAEAEVRDVRVVMITSAGAGEGKTTTATNLAVMMAEAGYETVLINCDHRRPRMHELAGVPYEPATVTRTSRPNLRLITDVRRGSNDSPATLSERQRSVIEKVRASADVVILDTAPLLATNDALDLLSVTDLVVLVAREGRTTAASATKSAELVVDRMGVPVAGVVITGSASEDRYYERYRYGGYYGKAPTADRAEAPPSPTDEVFDESVPSRDMGRTPPSAPPLPPVVNHVTPAASPRAVGQGAPTQEPFYDDRVAPPAVQPEPSPAPIEMDDSATTIDGDEDQPAWLLEILRATQAVRAQAGQQVIDLRDPRPVENSSAEATWQANRQ